MSHQHRSREDLIERVEALEAENEQLAEELDTALGWARDAHETVAEHHDRIRDLETTIEHLREDVEHDLAELRERTSLLAVVAEGQTDRDTKAAACIQLLAEDAGEGGTAEMTVREGWNALHRATDRTNMYDVYARAEALVDRVLGPEQQVVVYSDGTEPYTLVVDRSAGDLPQKYRRRGR